MTGNEEDGDSVVSVFRGGLDVDVLEIPWESDINRRVDIQIGEAEWATSINAVEGGLRVDEWGTEIIEISKGDDKFGPDTWSTAIHELPSDENLHEEWGTEIAERMTNLDTPINWSTKFNSIEKVNQRKSIWTTVFRKIQNRVAVADQWTTKFNSIGTDADAHVRKAEWRFKMPKRMTNLSEQSDWNTRINRTEGSTSSDTWANKFNEMLLQCDDRQTHWNTKFLDIRKDADDLDKPNTWDTTFKEIAPRDEGEPEIWDTTIYSISEEKDLPEHWNTKFTDIDRPVDESWSIEIEDVPDNFREPADWTTGFHRIENHEDNALWDTLFNGLVRDDLALRTWTTDLKTADISDIGREEWETNNNPIDEAETEWDISVNPIINHPTNNPVDD